MRTGPLKRSKKSLWIAAAAVAASQVPNAAKAAGIDMPENGASILARGGTYSSQLDTAYSLQFNPAGMTEVKGLDVRIDYRLISHNVSFQRDKSKVYGNLDSVSNTASAFGAPSIAVVYHHPTGLLSKFAFGVGAWGPPGVGTYQFADPVKVMDEYRKANPDADNEDLNTEVVKKAPQRYSQVKQDILIAYPSLGVAFQPHEKVSFGITLQAVYATIKFEQALGVNLLSTQTGEQPVNDAYVKLNAEQKLGRLRPTGIFGVLVKPMAGLSLNASFRPKIYIDAPGTVEVVLPKDLASLATVEGNSATLGLNLAPILRVGGAYKKNRLSTALELRWEGWSVNNQFKVATGVKVKPVTGDASNVGTLYIKNGWKDTYGVRLGGGYDILTPEKDKFLFQGNAGFLFETNAVPSEMQALPFVTGNIAAVSGGLTFGYKGFAITASGMYYIPATVTVTNSAQAQAVSNPENVTAENKVIVGNGTYSSKVWVAAIGLSYTGLGSAR